MANADLVLSISKKVYSSEFTVLLIVIILFSTIFFCHGLIRICMLIIKPPNEDEEQPPLPRLMEPGGYAVPRRPIHVILAQDEEAAGMDNVANKLEPPAYGLWRESVVCTNLYILRGNNNLTNKWHSAWIRIAYIGNVMTSLLRKPTKSATPVLRRLAHRPMHRRMAYPTLSRLVRGP